MLGASLTSVGCVLLLNLLIMAHVYPVFPLVPGPGEKEGSACLGTGTTGTPILMSMAVSTPPFPKVKWRVLWGLAHSMAVPQRSQTTMESQAKRADIFSSF